MKRRNVLMSYRYYDTDIRARWKVKLHVWPFGVRFIAPGQITTMGEIRILHEALSNGECRWVSMSQSEISELATQLKETPVVKTRKSRKRKTNENPDGDNGAEIQPVARRRRRTTTTKSRAMIEGDERSGAVV